MDGQSADLVCLNDELLLKILRAAGGTAIARAATLCRRLRHAQEQLAALPAFAAAASFGDEDVKESVRNSVLEAREQLPAGADVCLLFVAAPRPSTRRRQDSEMIDSLVPLCKSLLPPGALVVGCCGRGIFGVVGGAAAELDPSQNRAIGASVLLGRMPGCELRAFSLRGAPPGDWATEAECRAWLGLPVSDAGAGSDSSAAPPVQPLSCLLFAHPAAGGDVNECVEGLQAAFPGMVLTGGVASGRSELFCSQAPREPGEVEEGAQAEGKSGAAPAVGSSTSGVVARPQYVGLLVCAQQQEEGAGAGTKARVVGLSAQGMEGAKPLLTRVQVLRNLGVLQHPGNNHGQPEGEVELVGLSGAHTGAGEDATHLLTRLANAQAELGVWAAAQSSTDVGSFDAAVAAGQPAAVLQLYGVYEEDAEALATASNGDALAAVLEAAAQKGCMLCVQPLQLSPEGAKAALQVGVAELAAARPACHLLLPTATCGLVAVSCTAKGQQMHGAQGVEAGLMHAFSAGLPLAGVYCDGEIGPEITNGKAALRLAGGGASSDGVSHKSHVMVQAGCSKLQGFTTIVTALGCAM